MKALAHSKTNADRIIDLIGKQKEYVATFRDQQAKNLAMSGEHPAIIQCLQDDLEEKFSTIMEGLEALESAMQHQEVSQRDVESFKNWLSTTTHAIKAVLGFV